MTYRAPLDDILFALRLAAGEDAIAASETYGDLAGGVAEQTLTEAAKFAEEVLLPLDRIGDRVGATYANGAVTTAPGWREAYAQWKDGGWNAIAAAQDYGGLDLPALLNAGCTEIWNAANMAFAVCPLLGHGAIEAMEAHASDALKETYLHKIVSGEWTATMNLTEPGAGSDLGLMRTRAEPPTTAPIASSARRYSSPTANMILRPISCISCSRVFPTLPPARAAFRCFLRRKSCPTTGEAQ